MSLQTSGKHYLGSIIEPLLSSFYDNESIVHSVYMLFVSNFVSSYFGRNPNRCFLDSNIESRKKSLCRLMIIYWKSGEH